MNEDANENGKTSPDVAFIREVKMNEDANENGKTPPDVDFILSCFGLDSEFAVKDNIAFDPKDQVKDKIIQDIDAILNDTVVDNDANKSIILPEEVPDIGEQVEICMQEPHSPTSCTVIPAVDTTPIDLEVSREETFSFPAVENNAVLPAPAMDLALEVSPPLLDQTPAFVKYRRIKYHMKPVEELKTEEQKERKRQRDSSRDTKPKKIVKYRQDNALKESTNTVPIEINAELRVLIERLDPLKVKELVAPVKAISPPNAKKNEGQAIKDKRSSSSSSSSKSKNRRHSRESREKEQAEKHRSKSRKDTESKRSQTLVLKTKEDPPSLSEPKRSDSRRKHSESLSSASSSGSKRHSSSKDKLARRHSSHKVSGERRTSRDTKSAEADVSSDGKIPVERWKRETRRYLLMVGPKYVKMCQQHGLDSQKLIQTEHPVFWGKIKDYIDESLTLNRNAAQIEAKIDEELKLVFEAKKLADTSSNGVVFTPNVVPSPIPSPPSSSDEQKKQHEENFLKKIMAKKFPKHTSLIRPCKPLTDNCISLPSSEALPEQDAFDFLVDAVDNFRNTLGTPPTSEPEQARVSDPTEVPERSDDNIPDTPSTPTSANIISEPTKVAERADNTLCDTSSTPSTAGIFEPELTRVSEPTNVPEPRETNVYTFDSSTLIYPDRPLSGLSNASTVLHSDQLVIDEEMPLLSDDDIVAALSELLSSNIPEEERITTRNVAVTPATMPNTNDSASRVAAEKDPIDWHLLYDLNFHHESNTESKTQNCDSTSQMLEVFNNFLNHEMLFNRDLFPNAPPLPEGIEATAVAYRTKLITFSYQFEELSRNCVQDPNEFLKRVFQIDMENICVYAVCLLRLIQDMPCINAFISNILDKLCIIYYINPNAYKAVMGPRLSKLGDVTVKNFLEKIRIFNATKINLSQIENGMPSERALRELLCGSFYIGNFEPIMKFADVKVRTCDEIVVAWRNWSSANTNPRIIINRTILGATTQPATVPPATASNVKRPEVSGRESSQGNCYQPDVVLPSNYQHNSGTSAVSSSKTPTTRDNSPGQRFAVSYTNNAPSYSMPVRTTNQYPRYDNTYIDQMQSTGNATNAAPQTRQALPTLYNPYPSTDTRSIPQNSNNLTRQYCTPNAQQNNVHRATAGSQRVALPTSGYNVPSNNAVSQIQMTASTANVGNWQTNQLPTSHAHVPATWGSPGGHQSAARSTMRAFPYKPTTTVSSQAYIMPTTAMSVQGYVVPTTSMPVQGYNVPITTMPVEEYTVSNYLTGIPRSTWGMNHPPVPVQALRANTGDSLRTLSSNTRVLTYVQPATSQGYTSTGNTCQITEPARIQGRSSSAGNKRQSQTTIRTKTYKPPRALVPAQENIVPPRKKTPPVRTKSNPTLAVRHILDGTISSRPHPVQTVSPQNPMGFPKAASSPNALPVPFPQIQSVATVPNQQTARVQTVPLVEKAITPTESARTQELAVPQQPIETIITTVPEKITSAAASPTIVQENPCVPVGPATPENLTEQAEFHLNKYKHYLALMKEQGKTVQSNLEELATPVAEAPQGNLVVGLSEKHLQEIRELKDLLAAAFNSQETARFAPIRKALPIDEKVVIEIEDDDDAVPKVELDVSDTSIQIMDAQESQPASALASAHGFIEPVDFEIEEQEELSEHVYSCICGAIATLRCKCNSAIYCSDECRLKHIDEHLPTCHLSQGYV